MPISQSRMISLIRAARAFEQALNQARREALQRLRLSEQARREQNPKVTALDELRELCDLLHPQILVPEYPQHLANLAVEERHFATHRTYNDRRAAREASKRRAAGITPAAPSAPTLIPSQRPGSLTAPTKLEARTPQRQSIYDEVAEWEPGAPDPSLANDPEATGGAFQFDAPAQPQPLSEEKRKELDALAETWETRHRTGRE